MSKLTQKIIFKKYKVGKLIFSSELSSIYEGKNELNGESVALKFEKISNKFSFLESESYFLYLLKGIGIPKILSYGKFFNYKVLIEELLGESVYLIWKMKKNNMRQKLNDICLVALQCLDRLSYIHSKNIIHRDIKPFNFLFGKKDPELIYLIDFGLARKYRSSRTGKHIKFKNLKVINGSFRYISLNAIRGYEQSRRDDLESLGYMLIFLINKTLPWYKVEISKIGVKEKRRSIYQIKMNTSNEKLCAGLPSEFCDYISYCRNLSFEEDPDYNYLRNLFLQIIKRNEQLPDLELIKLLHFSWLKEQNIKIKKIEPCQNYISNKIKLSKEEENNSLKNRKNTHKRLYKQIKDSIDKAKSQEIPKINNNNFFKFDVNNINIILNKIDRNNDNATCNSKNYMRVINLNNQKKEINKKYKSPPQPIKVNEFFKKNMEKIPLPKNSNNKIKKINSTIIKNTIEKNRINTDLNTPKNTINSYGGKKIIFFNFSGNKNSNNVRINTSFGSPLNLTKYGVYRTLKEREKEKEIMYKKSNNTITNNINNEMIFINNYNQKINIDYYYTLDK